MIQSTMWKSLHSQAPMAIIDESDKEKKLLYFAYGSNLMSDRIHINIPLAIKKNIARLQGFCLAFSGYVHPWRGATATIESCQDSVVWGVVWEIPRCDAIKLNRQEVGYDQVQLQVETIDGQTMTCLSYQKKDVLQGNNHRKPSGVYKAVIVTGAIEHRLPSSYVEQLRLIEDNRHFGPVDIPIDLEKVLKKGLAVTHV